MSVGCSLLKQLSVPECSLVSSRVSECSVGSTRVDKCRMRSTRISECSVGSTKVDKCRMRSTIVICHITIHMQTPAGAKIGLIIEGINTAVVHCKALQNVLNCT